MNIKVLVSQLFNVPPEPKNIIPFPKPYYKCPKCGMKNGTWVKVVDIKVCWKCFREWVLENVPEIEVCYENKCNHISI